MHLLVSVVSPGEAAAALAGGADIIDVKNPAEGALGAATPATLRAIRAVVPAGVPLSAALGDAQPAAGSLALAAHAAALCGCVYVKVGLPNASDRAAVRALLAALRDAALTVDRPATVVAVAYADLARSGGFPPAALPDVAAEAGIGGVMLDTFHKHDGTLFDALEDRTIAAFNATARANGLLTALAGSIGAAQLERARTLAPDILGVRGAACEGGRNGTVSESRVRSLRARTGAPASLPSPPPPVTPSAVPASGR